MAHVTAQEAAALMLADGMEQLTLGEIDARLDAIGYRRDKACGPCFGPSRWLSGPHAGISHSNASWRICLKGKAQGAFHRDAPRGADFQALQDMRGWVFSVSRGRIHTF